jgi:glutathione synthase/RimK-type ligase-like ATP-grasp enzyme
MIAIHQKGGAFTERWVSYCVSRNLVYKFVDCYSSNIVEQLKNIDILLFHHHQGSAKDILFAKQLLYSLQKAGMVVFPDFNTGWHFDDKVGQKYLLEALGIREFVPTWVFYSKVEALQWAASTVFPKVFKLRGGAGSQNVKLARTRAHAMRLIKRAFGNGFSPYDGWGSLRERYRKYRLGKTSGSDVVKGVVRLFIPPPYARIMGRERGYAYFQEFMPNNTFDIRIIVIDGKAFALKRFVRENDFRASGSGYFAYGREEFDERCVKLSLDYTHLLKGQCVAYDFVFDTRSNPRLIEINYGFLPSGYDDCPGYWDEDLKWHESKFDPYGWMIELLIKTVDNKRVVSNPENLIF